MTPTGPPAEALASPAPTTAAATAVHAAPAPQSAVLAAPTGSASAAGSGAPLPNRRPTARGDGAATTAGVPVAVVVTANDSDPDDDPLKIKEVRPPHHGTATCAPVDPTAFRRRWRCVYIPAPGFAGRDDFAYAVADPSGETSTATVHVLVAPAPAATMTPTATPTRTPTATPAPIADSAYTRPASPPSL